MRRLKNTWANDRGIAVTQLALSATVLMLFAAFAVDLGWFLVNSNRIQRAAEAGALAGVVWMPDDEPVAIDRALRASSANGYTDGDDNAAVVVTPKPDGIENRLKVEITDIVDVFFLKIIGQGSQTITKEATAEFVKPLAMGSPDPRFGNDGSDPAGVDCVFDPVSNPDPDPCYWANIHGEYTHNGFGDAFSSFCQYGSINGDSSCTEARDHARRSGRGYMYSISPPPGGSFSVRVQSGEFEMGGGDPVRTGDNNNFCAGGVPCPGATGPTTRFTVRVPDATPLIPDSAVVCSVELGPIPPPANPDVYTWLDLCGPINPVGGDYTLEVEMRTPAAGSEAGLNRYSVSATSTAGIPRVTGVGDMSIFNNISGLTTFSLAEVPSYYAGRTLFVELFDPGDAVGANSITLIGPDGNPWPVCTNTVWRNSEPNWEAGDSWPAVPTAGDSNPGDCEINADRTQIPGDLYDGDWIRMRVDLPDSYSCVTCWWSIRYDYSGASVANDTTTWRAYIAGAPVRLVLGG